jgi:hypothetical protein
MGMPSASVQPGTQPQGKGFGQPINPPQNKQLSEMQAQASQQQMGIMDIPSQMTMDMPSSSIYTVPGTQPPQQPQQGQSVGKGARSTNSATSGQPQMGQPNMYPNTVGQWDNASIQPQQSQNRGGKGKG